jgi:hypothetical protein
VTLLQRTTRKLSLTAQGSAYYNQMQGAAEPPLRRGAGAHPDPEEAGGSSADHCAGHIWPGDVLCIPVLISKDLSSHSGRPGPKEERSHTGQKGSLLDSKTALQGVIIASDFAIEAPRRRGLPLTESRCSPRRSARAPLAVDLRAPQLVELIVEGLPPY